MRREISAIRPMCRILAGRAGNRTEAVPEQPERRCAWKRFRFSLTVKSLRFTMCIIGYMFRITDGWDGLRMEPYQEQADSDTGWRPSRFSWFLRDGKPRALQRMLI